MGLHFSKEEFRVRKSKVLDSMKDQNIDALLMFININKASMF